MGVSAGSLSPQRAHLMSFKWHGLCLCHNLSSHRKTARDCAWKVRDAIASSWEVYWQTGRALRGSQMDAPSMIFPGVFHGIWCGIILPRAFVQNSFLWVISFSIYIWRRKKIFSDFKNWNELELTGLTKVTVTCLINESKNTQHAFVFPIFFCFEQIDT